MILFLKLCFKNLYRFLTDAGYRNFIFLVIKFSGRKRNDPFHMKFKGRKIKVIDALSFVWQYWDIFTEEFYCFDAKTDRPVILDVGSNIGMSIIYFRLKYPGSVVYGFEPDPTAFEALSENMKSFGFPEDSVLINRAAAWIDNNGTGLNLSGADASYIASGESLTSGSVKVETIRLKEIIEKQERIDFLKMDIEGAEIPVIEDCSASLNKIDHLFIEYHSFPGHVQDLDKLLSIIKSSGFRIQVNSPFRYPRPFIRKSLHPYPDMDVQLNIFAFRYEEKNG